MSDFVMPSLGADMEFGTLLRWYVKPGDRVKRGDIVACVDTSKAEIQIEIFQDGVIGELIARPGERVPVGGVLATVEPLGAQAPVAVPAPSAAAAADGAVAAAPVPAPPVTAGAPAAPGLRIVTGERLRVSPLARRVAEQLGVDLAAVTGTGPHGSITRADVEHADAVPAPAAAARAGAPAAAPAPAIPAPRAAGDRQAAMREAIAALMARSKREIPHYYLQTQIDLSRALDWLHETNLGRSVNDRLLPSALMLSAVARAVSGMPELNGFWIDGAFVAGGGVHLGVAVALRGGGLIAPALHDADRLGLDEIMAGARDLVARARAGRLRSSEMSDPTITVTNLGDRGVDLVHGVIYPPQVALVGFGAVRDRPWAVDGMLGVRPIVTATLAGDHRASDGHAGGRLLTAIDQQLQNPEAL